jgi:hypothetical protein
VVNSKAYKDTNAGRSPIILTNILNKEGLARHLKRMDVWIEKVDR